ncbi:hypothetical protein [Silvanigrella aquatica]|uniref:Uncharacterized protein n=1 Tax=Silvanigrella aquatica TaxID=1915309 RepID=A0A1L4D0H3_9BACT|nr:hypothetical protein [Silvanigrella aquatica]APJ03687.1 hypothetical protein AXG55_07120 [Silvanigrella aquatica]
MLRFTCKKFVMSAIIFFLSLFGAAFATTPVSKNHEAKLPSVSITNILYAVGTNANFAQWTPVTSTWTGIGNWDLKMVTFDANGNLWSVGA